MTNAKWTIVPNPMTPLVPSCNNAPALIAHRGASARFPENTIIAYQAAVDAGAQFVELDVQITNDGIPIVHHDQDLLRMTGAKGDITTMNAAQVLERNGSYPEKFGDKFVDNPLSSLPKFVEWLAQHEQITAFVEIKRQSVEAFGTEAAARCVLEAIAPIKHRTVIISFHDGVVQTSRAIAPEVPIGWVLRKYNEASRNIAKVLHPDYLFCNTKRLPTDRVVWPGDWQWALYNADTVADALDYFNSGFELLETNCIIDLLASPKFARHE